MPHLPEFDELFVVSDLHMGGRSEGRRSFQVFNRGPRLAALVRQIAEARPDDHVALVLNGDVFDSLAEEEIDGYVTLESSAALRMMEHLYADPAFEQVWESLSELVGRPRRHLVLVIGNHDIEMALPVVEASIRRRLGGDGEVRSRIHFASHGGGFACRVGGARVFCTHGNELDEWNWVDYNRLGQLANAMNAGRSVDPADWPPNAGTRLVVDVMNGIKRRHPFVDLLKPEVAAVAGVLMALDREAFESVDLGAAFPVLRDKVRGRLVARNLLGADRATLSGVPVDTVAEEVAGELLGPRLRQAVNARRQRGEDELLLVAESVVAEGGDPEALAAEEEGTLGAWDLVSGWVGLVDRVEALRRALQDWLRDDRTFDVDFEDELFGKMEERIGPGVDFVVTGHTHKPRALTFADGARYYNSGTWIRTLRLSSEVLDDARAFEEDVWPLLASGSMADIDEAEIPGPDGSRVPLLLDRTVAVRISARDQATVGELLRVTDGATEGTVTLSPEPGTEAFEVRR